MAMSAFGVDDNRISKADRRDGYAAGAGAGAGAAGGYGAARGASALQNRNLKRGTRAIGTGPSTEVARKVKGLRAVRLGRGSALAAAGAGLGAAAGVSGRHVSKADTPVKASGGRMATGTMLPGYHAMAAGRKGKKLRAIGNETAGSMGGSILGSTAAALATRGRSTRAAMAGSSAGAIGGAYAGTARAQRKGYYKAEK